MVMKIHSGGGSLFGGYQAVGVMQNWISKGYEIETRVNGFAASAAFFIFCGGSTRLVSPQAELMWHELITFSMFDVSGPADKEDQAAVLRHLQDTANTMLADMCSLTKEEIDTKIRKKEYWMNGSDAFAVGFATGLLH
jgi:ATP-dependent protease ClpP protease subunit